MSAITDPAVIVFFCHLSVNPSDASIPVDTGTLPVAVDVHMEQVSSVWHSSTVL